MQTNIARASDYDQAWTAGNTRTTILIVDDDTTTRLTLSAMISNEDEYRRRWRYVPIIAVTRLDNQNLVREGS